MNATLTMVGVPRHVPTQLALSCAAVEVDSSLQAMDWTVMVWHCYHRVEGRGAQRFKNECVKTIGTFNSVPCREVPSIILYFFGRSPSM